MAIYAAINELRGAEDARGTSMAQHIKDDLAKEELGELNIAENKYDEDNVVGRLAGHKYFEVFTIAIICFNALIIGYDAEYSATIGKPDSLYEGPWQFIILENFFAVFFTFEIVVRFVGYRHKTWVVFDGWFVFDATLVTLMVLETWIIPLAGGDMPPFGPLRLLRLLRISRMAKLLKAIPELMTIIKGLAASVRAVSMTAILLLMATYIVAIIFTNAYHQGIIADGDEEDDATVNFGSMGKSFFALLIMGAIFDDLTYCTDSIRQSGNTLMLIVFIIYMLFSGFTVLNMLVGILAEVVQATSDSEKTAAKQTSLTDAIMSMAKEMDIDGNKRISKKEFDLILKDHKHVKSSLAEMDITDEVFHKFGEFAFSQANSTEDGKEPSITYEYLVDVICRLRPGMKVGALDFATFDYAMQDVMKSTNNRVKRLERLSTAYREHMPLDQVQAMLRSSVFVDAASPKDRSREKGERGASASAACAAACASAAHTPFLSMLPTSPGEAHGTQDTPLSGSGRIDGVAKHLLDKADTPRSPWRSAAAGAPYLGHVPESADDPLWLQLDSIEIIEEIQKRLNITDASKTQKQQEEDKTSAPEGIPSSAHMPFATLNTPDDDTR